MLTNKHLNEEIHNFDKTIEELKKDGQTYEASMLKALTLDLKLQQNIRANMVKVMDHLNISLIKNEKRDLNEKE